MLEEMTQEQLSAELIRAQQLAALCEQYGYPQAATIHQMTANALTAELVIRAEQNGGQA